MHSTFNHIMQCLSRVIPLNISVRDSLDQCSKGETNFGVSKILANAQKEIGAPYRYMTQIGWQVWGDLGKIVAESKNLSAFIIFIITVPTIL